MTHGRTIFLLLLATSVASRVDTQVASLTYEQALERARTRAPLILAAHDRIEEARGRLLGAKVLLRDNPALTFSGGPRYTPGSDLLDSEVGLSQSFELGGRRRSRIAGAQADVDRETAASRNTVRQLLGDVAIAFWQAVAAGEQVRLSGKANQVALELRESMQKRYEVGDVAVLDVNVARTAAARAQSELHRAESEQTRALGELRILLGMTSSEPLAVEGNLTEHNPYDLNQLITEATKRPDLEATAAELRQAEADVQLGRGSAWPDVGLGFRYGRDEGDKIAKGELSFTLPVFSRGQELRATGEARATRLRRELQAGRMAVANEVTTAFDIQKSKSNAAEQLQKDAVEALDENETLALRSFEEGEINLLDLLVIRRDSFETRLLYLSQLLDMKLAGVDLEAKAGVLK
jgi:cobalt-zinc-cadmium efflux system outer membrane protein